jgi:hypothetical protein
LAGPPHDPIRADLDLAWSLYVQLAARVPPDHQATGRRTLPGSRPPIDVQVVSHMADLERTIAWWINQARWLLDPWKKIDLTAREGIRCPYCQGALVAWIQSSNDEAGEVVCTNLDHPVTEGPNRWKKRDWPRLGVLADTHVDARFGARPPDLDLPNAASG